MYQLNAMSTIPITSVRLFYPENETIPDTWRDTIEEAGKRLYPTVALSDLPDLGTALMYFDSPFEEHELQLAEHLTYTAWAAKKHDRHLANISITFSKLKADEEILTFAKEYGPLGCQLINSPHALLDDDIYLERFNYAMCGYEPLIVWRWHIQHVKKLLTWFSELSEEHNQRKQDFLINHLVRVLKQGINLVPGNVESSPSYKVGFIIRESRTTDFLLAAIYYDIWRMLIDEAPVKKCIHCGNPFSSKRSDALYCSHRCTVAYSRAQKKKGD